MLAITLFPCFPVYLSTCFLVSLFPRCPHQRHARQQRHQPQPRDPDRLIAPRHRAVGEAARPGQVRPHQQPIAQRHERPRHEDAAQNNQQRSGSDQDGEPAQNSHNRPGMAPSPWFLIPGS